MGFLYDLANFNGNLESGIKIKINVQKKLLGSFTSNSIVSNIEHVDLYYYAVNNNIYAKPPSSFGQYTPVKNLSINDNAEIVIPSTVFYSPNNDGGGALGGDLVYGWLAIYWNNKKVVWVPFNLDYINNTSNQCKYEINFKSSSGEEMADELELIIK